MNLVLDIGNSAVKFGLFEEDQLMQSGIVSFQEIKILEDILSPDRFNLLIVSAVRDLPLDQKRLNQSAKQVIFLDEHTRIPIVNAYRTPQSLGLDRLANACGAYQLFPGKDVVCIDAGTCLKFDFITKDAHYLGGAISPGLRMRFKALHHFTARLPLLDPGNNPELIGTDTGSSIQSGVINGIIAEIQEIVRQYRERYPRCEIIITGGDSVFFLNHLKSRIFAAPELTLLGLNSILRFQSHD